MPLVWSNARRFFFWRMRRRVQEEDVIKKMVADSSKTSPMSRANCFKYLRAWSGIAKYDTDDVGVAQWLEKSIDDIKAKIKMLGRQGITSDITSLFGSDEKGAFEAVKQVIDMLPADKREKVLEFLSKP